ncbi:MAG: DJ-1/PfpI family protein [Chloroflexota bacterium]|nr:DJ-1/PfpI family protein [Chloroflexota bacterium]
MDAKRHAPWTVGILIFDAVEVLDFCGPFEVFATTGVSSGTAASGAPFSVFTVAETAALVRCQGGLLVQPQHTIADHPPLDLLVVPGGWGTRRAVHNAALLDWIAAQDQTTQLTLSVCTGAFLLAARGLLDGHPATTHWASLDRLQATYPQITVVRDRRYVDAGRIVTSAGISAGIDMALHVVRRLCGPAVAVATARRMEYTWTPAAA